MIKILVVERNKEPYIKEVEDKLDSYQEIVGGLIECINVEDDVDLVINEEGKINGMEYNRDLLAFGLFDAIFGTFFVVGVNYDTGEFKSLNDAQIKKYKRKFRL